MINCTVFNQSQPAGILCKNPRSYHEHIPRSFSTHFRFVLQIISGKYVSNFLHHYPTSVEVCEQILWVTFVSFYKSFLFWSLFFPVFASPTEDCLNHRPLSSGDDKHGDHWTLLDSATSGILPVHLKGLSFARSTGSNLFAWGNVLFYRFGKKVLNLRGILNAYFNVWYRRNYHEMWYVLMTNTKLGTFWYLINRYDIVLQIL